jgi:hypothetical protein
MSFEVGPMQQPIRRIVGRARTPSQRLASVEAMGDFDFRARLRYLESGDVRIPYIAPEDLLLLKQGSSLQKDRLDVAAMKEIIERERKAK